MPINVIGALAQFAEERGLSAEKILAGAGISPLLLRTDRARVTEDQLVALVQQMWRVTDDELFGAGTHPMPRGSFRMLCYALVGTKDMRGALDRLDGFMRAIPAVPVRIDIPEDGDEFSLAVDLRPRRPSSQLSLVIGLGATARLFAWMLRRNLAPNRIELPFSRPDDDEFLRSLLDGPVVYDAGRAALVMDRSWLGSPMMRNEGDIDELVRNSPRALITRPRYQTSVGEQVRRMVRAGLRRGDVPNADQLAARLAMSPQTLRRRLAEEGTSAREIAEEVRRDAAIAALVDGSESVADLSERLGYSEQSTFTRAFRKWTGSTPAAYRRRGNTDA